MPLQVNELKAVAVMADLLESEKSITQDKCMSVKHFDYRCARRRDSRGRACHANEPAWLTFSVCINSAEQAKPIYQQLTDSKRSPMSFLFNALFSDTKRLTDYYDAMVVEGYVVDVQEDFCSAALSGQEEEQIVLRVRMQVHSIKYVGKNDCKKLAFLQ